MIELNGLRKNYRVGDHDLAVLKGITLNIESGEYVALMGSSGSGKTTLMNLLGSLDHPTDGVYRLAGIDVSSLTPMELAAFRSQHIGFVFQNFNLLPRATALDNVLLPTIYASDGRSRRECVEDATRLLESVGLAGRLDHMPNQLSGGERQRIAIARALMNRPKLLLADEPTGNLDTVTEQEILALFRQLNQEHGITLVVVTHDAEVAHEADRVVRMKDGLVSEDVRQRESIVDRPSHANAQTATFREQTPVWPLAASWNAVMVAVMALRRNKLRTFLTMLGVIIGVASVISTMELSAGAATAIEETVASMGASMLTISPGKASSTSGRQRSIEIIPDDVVAVSRQCSAVKVAAPLIYSQVQLVRRNRRWSPNLALGTTPQYLEARNWDQLEMGTPFTEAQVLDASKVCILGKTVARELFDSEYPIGEEVRVNGVPLRVVGVLTEKGGDVIGNDQDDIIIGPWTTFKLRVNSSPGGAAKLSTFADLMPPMQLASMKRSTQREEIHQIYVEAISPDHVELARQQITRVLSRRHNVDPAGAYRINDITEVSRVVGQVVGGVSALGLVIAGVSLMVGGVGIMNIMLVSVTERTREIGLRMAVGADRSAILRQFLIEATVLCMVGGFVGIFAGHMWSSLVAQVIGWPTTMSIWAPIIAVSVAATVGIVFGYYPARTASRLNPIDALRYE
ncbi:Macrolide export ATP-binding/permease protein MacB [Rubripirellula lacrimiformis]|uniref:Macrolide export ATP-binding/permease protein MacB n=1 Tax=Rubripirellula lacrimiformis TaxID=1930273 RepID=A0A517NJJ8_9BACT|nr:ABC transporter permease [Rubripirellula lacrimiformis]QDT07306.1 Macrolide export ATP-binding/permease protein MacB [Rubripirellula lacrimiformis]